MGICPWVQMSVQKHCKLVGFSVRETVFLSSTFLCRVGSFRNTWGPYNGRSQHLVLSIFWTVLSSYVPPAPKFQVFRPLFKTTAFSIVWVDQHQGSKKAFIFFGCCDNDLSIIRPWGFGWKKSMRTETRRTSSVFETVTPLKFNRSPLKNGGWKITFPLGFGHFSGASC